MSNIQNLLKMSGDFYEFTGEELRLYIPESYFEKKLAADYGKYVSVFGLLDVETFKGGKSLGMDILNLPTMIEIFPTSMEPMTMTLTGKEEDKEKYYVAKFIGGDKFTNAAIRQDSSNVELFLKMMTGGKIPKSVPYNKLLDVWQKNLSLNNVNLGVPSTVLEVIIREIYRDPKQPEYTFSKAYNDNPKINQLNYYTANMREVCARNSVFAATTFEDFDQMVNSSINISSYKKSQTVSPIEKIIKM